MLKKQIATMGPPPSAITRGRWFSSSNQRRLMRIFAEEFGGLAPSGFLVSVELTEVTHLLLKHASS
jgi:hypothetical protein